MKTYVFIFLFCLQLSSCGKLDIFQKTVQIPQQEWWYNNTPSFTFSITDTTVFYNIFVVLRHTDAYRYNNIWLSLGSKVPGDKMQFQNIDLTLGIDANGWQGNGMDDIFEIRKNITNGPVHFKKPGLYTFTISQIMRENPLKDILDIGIRIEK